MEKKFTATQVLEAVKAMAQGEATEIPAEVIVEFCDTKIAQAAAKAVKAKERAAEKKAEGDALTDAIKQVLTEELQTREDILAQIEGDSLTVNKISARMKGLVDSGFAVKEQIKVGDAKRTAYKLA